MLPPVAVWLQCAGMRSTLRGGGGCHTLVSFFAVAVVFVCTTVYTPTLVGTSD
jgi:hypothetical protein